MDQASRILASWTTPSETDEALVTRERLVVGSWKKAVGKRLADRARALKLVRGRLVVGVDDEIWQRNLRGMRFQIIKNLEAAVGPGMVTEIEFRVLPKRMEPQRAGLEVLRAPDESDGIADSGLRRIYRNSRRRETA